MPTCAYMPSSANAINVFNTSTDSIITSGISVGNDPTGVAFTPDGTKAFIANQTSGTISVIDTVSATVVHTISVSPSGYPYGVAIGVTANGTYAYVTVKNADTTLADFVLVIDTSSYTIVSPSPIYLTVKCYPYGVAITPDGSYVYVAISTTQYSGNGSVSIIQTSNNTLISGSITFTTPQANYPWGVAISPTGSPPTAYVTLDSLEYLGHVAVFPANGSTSVSITYVTVSYRPRGIAITPDGTTVFTANFGSNSTPDGNVSYFSTSPLPTMASDYNNTVLYYAFGIAVTPDGSKAYVGTNGGNTVVMSTSSHTAISTISSTGGNAFGIFIQQNAFAGPFTGGPGSDWFGL